MPSRAELVAHNRDSEGVANAIGADLVIFQTLPDLISSVRQFNPKIVQFECSVFTGDYITGGVDEDYLQHLEKLRSDNVKDKVMLGGIGTMEGKGGGGLLRVGTGEHQKVGSRRGGTKANSDNTVGLHNSWKVSIGSSRHLVQSNQFNSF